MPFPSLLIHKQSVMAERDHNSEHYQLYQGRYYMYVTLWLNESLEGLVYMYIINFSSQSFTEPDKIIFLPICSKIRAGISWWL